LTTVRGACISVIANYRSERAIAANAGIIRAGIAICAGDRGEIASAVGAGVNGTQVTVIACERCSCLTP